MGGWFVHLAVQILVVCFPQPCVFRRSKLGISKEVGRKYFHHALKRLVMPQLVMSSWENDQSFFSAQCLFIFPAGFPIMLMTSCWILSAQVMEISTDSMDTLHSLPNA